jgi:hypothetical protein
MIAGSIADRARGRPTPREAPTVSRHALNSARHRLRKRRGQEVYRVTANSERLIDLLVREGLLRDGVIHDHATIELALTHWIDDEASK